MGIMTYEDYVYCKSRARRRYTTRDKWQKARKLFKENMEGRVLVNKLIGGKIYFPKFHMSYESRVVGMADGTNVEGVELTFATLVRMQAEDGHWYRCPVVKKFSSHTGNAAENLLDYAGKLLDQAYNTMLLGKVPHHVVDVTGSSLCEFDEIQYNEEKRLIELNSGN